MTTATLIHLYAKLRSLSTSFIFSAQSSYPSSHLTPGKKEHKSIPQDLKPFLQRELCSSSICCDLRSQRNSLPKCYDTGETPSSLAISFLQIERWTLSLPILTGLIVDVDGRSHENNLAHRTREIDRERLIVRRGQPFSITLQCSDSLPPGHHLELVLHLGEYRSTWNICAPSSI